ncbi:MAG: Cof-type HAD-IIB family hydrolase [Alicyclobacillus sp.]|nr:Cof-type HAD-IIB family hydrolase [Alicyclobacillus sp.]
MKYKIVFFDIDGTLVNDDKEIPKSTIDAVQQLKTKGIESAIATGRAPYLFKSIAEQLGIDSYVSLNGAYVVYKGELIKDYPIPKEDLAQLVRQAESHGHPLVFQGADGYYANARNHPYIIASVGSLKVEFPGYDPQYWQKASIYQAFLHCPVEEEHLYNHEFPNLRLVRWHPFAFDVMPSGGSKARGIMDLLHYLNLQPAEAVSFGDSLNDREMLAFVGCGIAMGNAGEELKRLADFVTTSVDEGGIVHGLKAIGLI